MSINKKVHRVLEWVKYVELGGACIVVFVVGLLLGEMSQGSIDQVAQLFRQLAGIASVVLGCAVVYFVQYDKRKAHTRILISGMAAVIVSNLALMFAIFVHPIIDILVSFGGVLVLIVLLQIALDGYNKCKHCDTREQALKRH